MTIATKKKLSWFLLAFGVASVILFAILLIQRGSLPTGRDAPPVYGWMLLSVFSGIWSLFALRRLYRLEPAQASGFWHLTLVDLFATTFFSGFCMALWRALWEGSLLPWGIAAALCAGGGLVAALLSAERRGFKSPRLRYPLALGFLLRTYGLLGLAGLCGIIVVAILGFFFQGDGPAKILWQVLFRCWDDPTRQWLPLFLWTSFAAYPLGVIVCKSVERSLLIRSPDYEE